MMPQAISLLELNRRVARLVSHPDTQSVWVTAELSDVRVVRGHCYMELLEKDAQGVNTLAKVRATIWASVYQQLSRDFYAATGQPFATGLKVMLQGSVAYHPLYGLSFTVTAVNPEFTMGDLQRRRREILAMLEKEGILDFNRSLEWPIVPQRIAVISAPGAAGYGDFMDQLYHNPRRLRFTTRLFPATMQGNSAPASIIASLEQIAQDEEEWDCVVIIRGGGATSDLVAFEDYQLAANVAAFPLPVVIGIGHERDITVLDFVANMRVKTPTAAAEWLIARGAAALDGVVSLASGIHRAVAERIAAEFQRLSYAEALLPVAPVNALGRAMGRLGECAVKLMRVSADRIAPERGRLDTVARSLPAALEGVLARNAERLAAREKLLAVLSPEATLARGYSITRIDGHAVTDASQVPEGAVIHTVLAHGTLVSKKI